MEKTGMYYFNLMMRYWFVIVVFATLSGAASYYFQLRQPPMYSSNVKIFIGNALSSPDPEVSSFESAERLALTYAELVRSYQLLEQAIQPVDPDIDVDFLVELVGVEVISDTSVIIITVRDTDPERAAELANAIAATLDTETPSTLTTEQASQLARLESQIDNLSDLIAITNEQHQAALGAVDDGTESVSAVTTFTDQLNSSYSSLAVLENEYLNLSNRISTLEVIDPARPNYESLGLNPIIIAVAGIFLGIIIAASSIIILDIFDTTLRTENDITQSIDAPIIGSIDRNRWAIERVREDVYSGHLLASKTYSQYQITLSNILFASSQSAISQTNSIFVVTSPQSGNGRSFTSVNLAIAGAEAGLKVLLVDVDGQNPSIHQFLGLDNDRYALSRLVDYLMYNQIALDVDENISNLHDKVIQTVGEIENLYIIPSGRPETLKKRTIPRLRILRDFLHHVRDLHGYDLILMDTSAHDVSPDALNLVAVTRGRVLLVLEAKGTTESVASKVASDFKRLGHDIDGIIMN